MTVKELKQWLLDYDDDVEVGFTYNYGDYWRTNVVARVVGLQERQVIHSDYHDMERLVDADEEYDGRWIDNNHRTVIVLHGK